MIWLTQKNIRKTKMKIKKIDSKISEVIFWVCDAKRELTRRRDSPWTKTGRRGSPHPLSRVHLWVASCRAVSSLVNSRDRLDHVRDQVNAHLLAQQCSRSWWKALPIAARVCRATESSLSIQLDRVEGWRARNRGRCFTGKRCTSFPCGERDKDHSCHSDKLLDPLASIILEFL